MVHYVFTPWRDRHELLTVRRQFYPDGTAASALASRDAAAAAVARVAVWMQRGHCPHMVESTALLAAAAMMEAGDAASTAPAAYASAAYASAAYAARAAYAAAFSRFVTGLLDGHQDRARKLSMHGLARTIGLPPAFVELRHQATHEPLPALRRLRAGARQALAWIWQYYWVHLDGGGEDDDDDDDDDACLVAVAACVDADNNTLPDSAAVVRQWGDERVLAALATLAATKEDGSAPSARTLRCMRLSRQVLQQKAAVAAAAAEPRRTRGAATKPENGGGDDDDDDGDDDDDDDDDSDDDDDDSDRARPWTAANLDLDAVRAAVAQQRQALYAMGGGEQEEEEEEEDDHVNEDDITMAEPDADTDTDTGDTWPAPRPRWTRYEGTWTPQPIGAVVRGHGGRTGLPTGASARGREKH